jgi:CheY-like chemotaxis protein
MRRTSVLVIDDHPANTKLVSFVLESRGYEVYAAENSEQAKDLLDRIQPDIILMDIQLPGTDGLTLTRELRADPRFAETPIVAVTAYAMAADEQMAREAGCDAYVSKPIDTRALGLLVARMIEKGRNHDWSDPSRR